MWVLVILVALVSSASPAVACDQALAAPASLNQIDDSTSLHEMLTLINHGRAQAGQPPLVFDGTLAGAARAHVLQMLQHGDVSHQFAGEPDLGRRLEMVHMRFDLAAENVGQDRTVARAHQNFMKSPSHRENLLDPSYDAVGIALARDGCKIYVVIDFAHRVPGYSAAQAENRVAEQIASLRSATDLPRLQRKQDAELNHVACAAARAGHPNARSAGSARYVVSYSNSRPDILPKSAERMIADASLRNFSVGTCYAQNDDHPGGQYYVTMLFY